MLSAWIFRKCVVFLLKSEVALKYHNRLPYPTPSNVQNRMRSMANPQIMFPVPTLARRLL